MAPSNVGIIELYINEDSAQNQRTRHSGAGRNPARHTAPRSGQSRVSGLAPLRGRLIIAWIPACAGMTVAIYASVMN